MPISSKRSLSLRRKQLNSEKFFDSGEIYLKKICF